MFGLRDKPGLRYNKAILKIFASKLFFIILFVAIVLRVFALGEVPPGVNRDEASIGYTAYSLLYTGKDEYGRWLPVSFQSFGDWKLPVYIYETVLSVAIFGLNTFAVRFPSAVAGVILVVLSYFLTKKLFKDKTLALAVMFLTAISPWSIHFSRVGAETNTAACLVTGGVLLFLHSLKKQGWLVIPAAVLLALSFGTYAANFIFTPLLVMGLFLLYRKEFLSNPSSWIAIVIFIFLSGFLWLQVTGANVTKISGTGIFGDPAVVNAEIEIPRNEHLKGTRKIAQFLHNKAQYGAGRFVQNYLNAFSPEFLFFRGGGNHAHNILNFGNMYLVEALFLFLGFAYLIMGKKDKSALLVLWWFLISPLAASITKDAPHTARMFAIFPMLPLVTAFGLLWLVKLLSGLLRYGVIVLIVVLLGYNISLYLDRYYIHFPYEEGQSWGVLYQQINTILSQKQFANKKVVMGNVQESPYIYFLFYGKYDPRLYQKQAIRYPMTSEGFVHVKQFGRYTFRDIDWSKDPNLNNTYLIARSDSIPLKIKKRFKIINVSLPSGNPMYSIVEGTDKIKIPPDKYLPLPL